MTAQRIHSDRQHSLYICTGTSKSPVIINMPTETAAIHMFSQGHSFSLQVQPQR